CERGPVSRRRDRADRAPGVERSRGAPRRRRLQGAPRRAVSASSIPGPPGYLSVTEADRDAMLDAIGVASIDELFEQIPEGVGLGRALDVPEALPEAALVRHLEELSGRNGDKSRQLSFLGVGR